MCILFIVGKGWPKSLKFVCKDEMTLEVIAIAGEVGAGAGR